MGDSSLIPQSLRVARCECRECKSAVDIHEIYTKPKFSDYADIRPKKVPGLSDHQYMIMASHMFAFILKDRIYGTSQLWLH